MNSEWDRCAPWIQAALDDGGNVYTLEDIAELVRDGDATLWPGRNSAVVTRIETYPRARWLLLWLGGGELDEIRDEIIPATEAFALTHRCTKTVIIGRFGWSKALRAQGYEPLAAVVGKDIGQ